MEEDFSGPPLVTSRRQQHHKMKLRKASIQCCALPQCYCGLGLCRYYQQAGRVRPKDQYFRTFFAAADRCE